MTDTNISVDTSPTPEATAPAREYPSRLMAGLYLLIGIAALIFSSNAEASTLQNYLVGIVVEIALALLALLFIRLEKLSLPATLRLHWPGWKVMGLTALLAPGLWVAGITLNLFTTLIFGYTTPVTPAMFPRNALEAAVMAFTTMVIAPLCEEAMFRGYYQRAHERRRPWLGIVVGGVIFAIYHLRFQGMFALLPVALVLGFIAWRSDSLFPVILLHSVYNGIATVLLIATTFIPYPEVGVLIGMAVCAGVLFTPLSIGALWMLVRSTQAPAPPPPADKKPGLLRRWAWTVPLLLLLLVYGYASLNELLVGRFPRLVVQDPLALNAGESWDEPARWSYVIQNLWADELGEATCRREPQAESLELTCQVEHEGFDFREEFPLNIELDQEIPLLERFSSPAISWSQTALWSPDALYLLEARGTREQEEGVLSWEYEGEQTSLLVVEREDGTSETLELPETGYVLLDGEWPWRLAGMTLELVEGGEATLVTFDDDGAPMVREAFVYVQGGEPSWTPQTNFVTWKVTVSYEDEEGREITQSAWYDADAPHTLVRYEDGAVSYILSEYE